MSSRLNGYEKAASQARVRQLLAAQGGVLAMSDVIGNRLSELKGNPQGPEEALKSSEKPAPKEPARLSSMRDMLTSQLRDMESRCDALNVDLADVRVILQT